MIDALDIQKIYRTGQREVMAVHDVNLKVEKGKMIAILGRSGSGKSTLLNVLSGLLSPTEGTVLVDETDIYRLTDREQAKWRNRKTGIVPQGQSSLGNLTVLDNVLLPFLLFPDEAGERIPKELAVQRADEVLKQVGLEQLAGAYPSQLSGGENRRLVIARALVNQPEYLFADEPTADLDSQNTGQVIELLRRAADGGASVVFVTHELDTVQCADEVYTMRDGTLERDT